jgi:adenylate kinase family enzyme
MISASPTLPLSVEAPAPGSAGARPEDSLPYALNPCRIHILGGRGSGATLLGLALAGEFQTTVLDTDNFFWCPTRPAFQARRSPHSRRVQLLEALHDNPRVIVCGSVAGWGQAVESVFDLVIALVPPRPIFDPIIRRPRSVAIRPDSRDQRRHDHWVTRCICPVVQLETTLGIADRVDETLRFIRHEGQRQLAGLFPS